MGPGGILALDLSAIVGWAYGTVDAAAPISGTWHLASGCLGRRLASFENALEDALQLHAPSLVVTEAPLPPTAISNAATWRQQLSLAGLAEATAWRHDIAFREEACSTMRREILGTGRLGRDPKPAILAWARRMGWPAVDHNAADALLTWEFARRVVGRRRVA